jgi:hypothetical protein
MILHGNCGMSQEEERRESRRQESEVRMNAEEFYSAF